MITKDIPITVLDAGAQPPDGKDLHEELSKSPFARLGFQWRPDWLNVMLKRLCLSETLKTGTKIRVTMEIIRRTEEEEFSHINRNLHAFQALTGRVSLQEYWDEYYDQYRLDGNSLYECLCEDMNLDPIGGFNSEHEHIKL